MSVLFFFCKSNIFRVVSFPTPQERNTSRGHWVFSRVPLWETEGAHPETEGAHPGALDWFGHGNVPMFVGLGFGTPFSRIWVSTCGKGVGVGKPKGQRHHVRIPETFEIRKKQYTLRVHAPS